MKFRAAYQLALRHPGPTTLAVVVPVSAFSLAAAVVAMRLSDLPLLPVAIYLSVGLPALTLPLILYPLLVVMRRQQVLHAELARQARVDALTELPNRRAFFEFAGALVDKRPAGPGRLTAMMIDVDDFKFINDNFGHDHGDAVLKRIAGTIRSAVEQAGAGNWIVARLGGEEFVAMVDGLAPSAVGRLAERICNQVHASVGAGAELDPVTVSIGVAFHEPGEGVDKLLKAADGAVYVAKRGGRDRWAFAGADMGAEAGEPRRAEDRRAENAA